MLKRKNIHIIYSYSYLHNFKHFLLHQYISDKISKEKTISFTVLVTEKIAKQEINQS